MKPLSKLWIAALCAGLFIAFVGYGWSARVKDDAAFHFANGVQVTPIEAKQDDITVALDAHIWKFDVVVPNVDKGYQYELLLCHQGKVVGLLGGVGLGPPLKPGEANPQAMLTVGMVPVGNTFGRAQSMKYSLHTDNGGTVGVFPNPLKNTIEYGEDVQADPSNNRVYLTSGSLSRSTYGDIGKNDIAIALSIKPNMTTITR